MMKNHHKGNFNLMFVSYFLMIYGWAYAGQLREELWKSSTTNNNVAR